MTGCLKLGHTTLYYLGQEGFAGRSDPAGEDVRQHGHVRHPVITVRCTD